MTVDTRVRVDPRDHAVLFYESTEELVTMVAEFVATGVWADETSIVVATQRHILAFEDALVAAGIDVDVARANGSLVVIDAANAMSRFLINDWPEARRFDLEFGQMVERLTASGRPVRVYGEMVALLWDAGHVAAAIELEALWNELGRRVPFSLLCAYPAASVADNGESFQQLCHCHSAVVGAGSNTTRAGVARSFLGDAGSLSGARHFVVETLRSWDLDRLCDDAAIVVSELATNAVLHARSDFTVEVSLTDGNVRLAVVDASAQPPVVQAPSSSMISGRGLVLVSALGASWGTSPVGDGKEVWVEFH